MIKELKMVKMKKNVCLIILDGWGIGNEDISNPIYQTPTPTFDLIKKHYPFTSLQASGMAVGLPWLEEGNSEVGHLILGSGRIVYQYYPRINLAIENKSFFQNPVITNFFKHIKENKSHGHLIGLLTSGNVHSSFGHLIALLDWVKQTKIFNLKLHLITDGRDSPPQAALELVKKLREEITNRGGQIEIASLSGRFYAMDKENNWPRIKRVYETIVLGKGKRIKSPEDYLLSSYREGFNDQFIEPALVEGDNLIKDNDALFFFNFREDGIKELVQYFNSDEDFLGGVKERPKNLFIATMTQIKINPPPPAAFPAEIINNTLAEVLSKNQKRQLHLAEAAKSAHITYFFDGLREKPFPGEYWVIIPSLETLHYEQFPELMAKEVTNRLLEAIEENIYDFILVNYANPDLIGHTGNFEAAKACVHFMDSELKRVLDFGLKHNATFFITADHGNIERMLNPYTGRIETQHDPNPVPFYLVSNDFYQPNPLSEEEIKRKEKIISGVLSDVAPTILEILNLPKPAEMSGKSLLRQMIVRA